MATSMPRRQRIQMPPVGARNWYARGVARESKAGTFTGEERDRIYDQQVQHMPGFGDYAVKTEGIRKIPVLELKRR
jgi:hypothetical protein